MKKQPFKITYKGSRLLKLAKEEERQCYFYEIAEKPLDEPLADHHIILLGLTESMAADLEAVKNSLKAILRDIGKYENQYISIVFFAGHQTVRSILEGVKAEPQTYRKEKVYKKIEQEKEIRKGCVLSEALEYVRHLIEAFNLSVKTRHHIYLLCDEESLAEKWDMQEEEKKCYQLVSSLRKNDISLNAIGAGRFYNRSFLMELIKRTDGKLLHVDEAGEIKKAVLLLIHESIKKSAQKLELFNKDVFAAGSYKLYQENRKVLVVQGIRKEDLIVVYDEPLALNGYRSRAKARGASDFTVQTFLYHLAAYKLKEGKLDESCFILNELEDTLAYTRIRNSFAMTEQGRALNLLYKLAENPQKRHKEQKQEDYKKSEQADEPLCLLEVLKLMTDDPETQLFWDYGTKYEYSGIKKKAAIGQYEMIKPKSGFGCVEKLLIGEKKLNVGLQVKVEGQVEDLETHLKLDAFIYREYHLVVNGNIKVSELNCILSKALRRKLKAQKLIKQDFTYGQQLISVINLRKLKVVNERVRKSLSFLQVVRGICDIETIKIREKVLANLMEQLRQDSRKQEEEKKVTPQEKIRNHYGIDKKGLFTLQKTEEDSTGPYKIYRGSIIEWKLEKFPKNKAEQAAMTHYKSCLTERPVEDYLRLEAEFRILKYTRYIEELKIQFVRLACGIMNEELCLWDEIYVKPKKQIDKVSGLNSIVEGRKRVYKKYAEGLAFKQERYEILIKSSLKGD